MNKWLANEKGKLSGKPGEESGEREAQITNN